jgi:spore maturation protein CgeB
VKIVIFCHSLVSDWNHGNAHFLRGVVTELQERGHAVRVLEPANSWSVENMLKDGGREALRNFERAYPTLHSTDYKLDSIDLDSELSGVDLVLVHEWNEPELVSRIGEHHARNPHYALLFHDTHHRSVTQPEAMAMFDLRHYDGVLAFGNVVRDLYLKNGWAERAWTWHEAADDRVFKPTVGNTEKEGDLVWIGNWGDEERTEELHEFLLDPVKRLGLKAKVYGVRYPEAGLRALAEAGIEYAGWLPNYEAPQVFAKYKMTVHVPRRPYVQALPGIPTIRVFESLACGIPLICSPWQDSENLFTPGEDYLSAWNGKEMEQQMSWLLSEPALGQRLVEQGRRTILARHTCRHRVDELLEIVGSIQPKVSAGRVA